MIAWMPNFMVEWYDVMIAALLDDAEPSPNTTLADVTPLHTKPEGHSLLLQLAEVISLSIEIGYPHKRRLYPPPVTCASRAIIKGVYRHASIYVGAKRGFPIHRDEPKLLHGCTTNTTILAYTSADFTGGALRFPDRGVVLKVSPRDVVVFPHSYHHTSDDVLTGAKTFLRMSAMIDWGA